MDNVLIPRDQLCKLLDYILESEYVHYCESLPFASQVAEDNHIFKIASSLLDCISAQ
jgi:hypothetical protein